MKAAGVRLGAEKARGLAEGQVECSCNSRYFDGARSVRRELLIATARDAPIVGRLDVPDLQRPGSNYAPTIVI